VLLFGAVDVTVSRFPTIWIYVGLQCDALRITDVVASAHAAIPLLHQR